MSPHMSPPIEVRSCQHVLGHHEPMLVLIDDSGLGVCKHPHVSGQNAVKGRHATQSLW